jgi:Xaa-Pro aminopeptidase
MSSIAVPSMAEAQARRLASARALLDRLELDALLISRGALKRWLSGFVLLRGEDPSHGFAGTLLITRDAQLILADGRYTEQAEAEAPDWILIATTRKLSRELVDLFSAHGIVRCGAEARLLSHETWDRVSELAPGTTLVAVDEELIPLRIVKDEIELRAIERACSLTDACFDQVQPLIRAGITELELTWQLEDLIRQSGAETLSFDSIVLFGGRAAMPHGRPGETRLETGQAVLLDFGAQFDGYHADMTRTVFCGDPGPEIRRLYQLVADAQVAGEQTVRPGIAGSEVHATAAAHIVANGEPAFDHGLGHGIGLEIHEPPSLGRPDDPDHDPRPLDVGMTFTIEPGIYLPGRVGIRIEDDYLLGDAGLRRLTRSSRDLIVVGQ